MLATRLDLKSEIPQLPARDLDDKCWTERAWPECNNGDPWDGYWWFGEWVSGMPTIESWFSGSPVWTSGGAVYYSPGIMEATAEYRGFSLDGYLGGVAMMSCADIGLPIWIKYGIWRGPYLVVDCARRNDMVGATIIRQEVVEVDWQTAQEWGIEWKIPVQVSKVNPWLLRFMDGPVHFPTWWENQASYSHIPDQRPLYMGGSTWRFDGKEFVTFERPRFHSLSEITTRAVSRVMVE